MWLFSLDDSNCESWWLRINFENFFSCPRQWKALDESRGSRSGVPKRGLEVSEREQGRGMIEVWCGTTDGPNTAPLSGECLLAAIVVSHRWLKNGRAENESPWIMLGVSRNTATRDSWHVQIGTCHTTRVVRFGPNHASVHRSFPYHESLDIGRAPSHKSCTGLQGLSSITVSLPPMELHTPQLASSSTSTLTTLTCDSFLPQ